MSIVQRKEIIDTLIDKICVYPMISGQKRISCKIEWKKDISDKYEEMYEHIYENLPENEK